MTTAGRITVSVIICCYTEERWEDIREAIASVQAQTRPADEIILAVDNNRTLYHRMIVETGDQVCVVPNDFSRGVSANRNTGIGAATGDIVVFLDDDAVAHVDWLENLVQRFEDPLVMAVGGEVVPAWPKEKAPFWFPEEIDFILGCTEHKKLVMTRDNQIRNVSGTSMAFRREVFSKVGLLDTGVSRKEGRWAGQNLRGGEEANICMRISAGIPQARIMHEPRALVVHKIHPRRTTLKFLLEYCVNEGLTRAQLEAIANGLVVNPLRAERLFIRRVLFGSIPRRLLNFYQLERIVQAGILIASIALMGVGYVIGKFKYRKVARQWQI